MEANNPTKKPRKKRLNWKEFIDSNPPITEQNPNASDFIPIAVVENDLTTLDPFWGTENFKFRVFEIAGTWYVSSSLELVISYGGGKRKLLGASTIRVEYDNPYMDNMEAISLSESTKSAAKKIGNRFGKNLNDRMPEDVLRTDTPVTNGKRQPIKRDPINAIKMKPTEKILAQYEKAIRDNNTPLITSLLAIYELTNE